MTRLLVCIALALAVPASARAQDEPAAEARSAEDVLAEGLAAFQDLEYRSAIEALTPLRTDPSATRAQRLQALELIGISHLILREERAAEAAFRDLLALDPGYQLRHDDGSPKIGQLVERLRVEVAPEPSGGEVRLDHTVPRGAEAGGRAELETVVLPGGQRPAEVLVHWRRGSRRGYDRLPLREVEDGRWRGRLPLPESERDYRVDYYIEARGLAGAPVAQVGDAEAPLTLAVAGAEAATSPWYARWYVWAGGAAVLGAGAAIAITGRDRTPDGSLDPGRITLSP